MAKLPETSAECPLEEIRFPRQWEQLFIECHMLTSCFLTEVLAEEMKGLVILPVTHREICY